jgi:hypothetical protein
MEARGKKRSTAVEYQRRVGEVYTLLLAGLGRRDVLQYVASEKCTWKASLRQIDNYIADARRQFVEFARPEREEEFGRALQRLDNLYSRALNIQDYKTCIQILKERGDMLGLHAPKKRELSGPGGGPIPLDATTREAPMDLKDLSDAEIETLRAIQRRRAEKAAASATDEA